MTDDAVLRGAAEVAAGLALTSAAVTAYWTLGGTALLDTVGGYPEELARRRDAVAVLVGALVVAVKAVAALVALGLAGTPTRPPYRVVRLAGALGGGLAIATWQSGRVFRAASTGTGRVRTGR